MDHIRIDFESRDQGLSFILSYKERCSCDVEHLAVHSHLYSNAVDLLNPTPSSKLTLFTPVSRTTEAKTMSGALDNCEPTAGNIHFISNPHFRSRIAFA